MLSSPQNTLPPQHCRQAPYPRCSSRDQRTEPRAGAGCEALKEVGGWLRGPPPRMLNKNCWSSGECVSERRAWGGQDAWETLDSKGLVQEKQKAL